MASCCCWPPRACRLARKKFLDREEAEDAAVPYLPSDGADLQAFLDVSCGRCRALRDVAYASGGACFGGKPRDVLAGEGDFARAGFHHTGDAAQRAGLAHAVAPHEAETLAIWHFKLDAAEDAAATDAEFERLYREHGRGLNAETQRRREEGHLRLGSLRFCGSAFHLNGCASCGRDRRRGRGRRFALHRRRLRRARCPGAIQSLCGRWRSGGRRPCHAR